MKDEDPLVSVIVPCYNHGKFIVECINSIKRQSYKNIELTVIDDGSIDNSVNILRQLQNEYDFNLIVQENRGLPATLNKGIKEYVKGKYIAICASDDYWALDKIEKQVLYMEANESFAMCYGKTYYVDKNSDIILGLNKFDYRLKGGRIFEDIFLFKFHPPVNYFLRASVYQEVGYYDEAIFADDYYMNLKIASKYPIGFLNEFLGYYRVDYDFNKVIRFDKVSDSHLMAIEEYKDHHLYSMAKRIVFLQKFDVFSGYKKHKKIALINLTKCYTLFYKKQFISSFIKFLFLWK